MVCPAATHWPFITRTRTQVSSRTEEEPKGRLRDANFEAEEAASPEPRRPGRISAEYNGRNADETKEAAAVHPG